MKVELIGYAATDDELFLIYEHAQKGSLNSHLHDPQNKGGIPFYVVFPFIILVFQL